MNLKEAKKILPKSEFETFDAVIADRIGWTKPARLKQLALQARRLKSKYQDLARQQGHDIRARGTYEMDTDIQDRRARLYQEIYERLQDELDAR